MEFDRPNGIWVADDMVFVVERDNHRIQVLTLYEFKFVGFIGEDKLIYPYGISIYKDNGKYQVYITDNYENEQATNDLEEIPADSLLGKRVLHYTMTIENGIGQSEFVRYIGETTKKGAIRITESIFTDPIHNILLLAEEDERNTHIKIYSLDKGEYTGKTIGEGMFNYQAEGIALIDCGNGEGFWICTDQYTGDNTFFKSGATQNTDGIWLTQEFYQGFPKGSLIAVNNDGGIGIYDLQMLMNELNISCK